MADEKKDDATQPEKPTPAEAEKKQADTGNEGNEGVPETALRPKQTLILLGLFILGLVIVWGVLSVLGSNALDSAVSDWEAAGGKVALIDLEPPPVNAEENAAPLYMASYPHLATLGQREWAVLQAPWRIQNPELLDLLLEQGKPALELAHRAARIEKAVWPIDYENPDATADSAAKALAPTRQLAVLLAAEAYDRVQDGDTQGAAASIRTGLILAYHVCQNPLLVNTVVAVSETQMPAGESAPPPGIEETMITALMVCFRDRPLPENHRIDQLLTMLDYRQTYVEALWAEGTLGIAHFTADDALARASESLSLANEDVPWWYVSGVARLDQGRYLSSLRDSIDRLSKPFYEQLKMPEAPPAADWALLTRNVMPASDAEMNLRIAAAEARRQLGITAVRMRAYVDKFGKYPESVTAIRPVAIDPFTGRPVNYMTADDGFIIGTSGYGSASSLTWDWSKPMVGEEAADGEADAGEGDADAEAEGEAVDEAAEPAGEAEGEAAPAE